MNIEDLKDNTITIIKDKTVRTILNPINSIVDDNITDISTSIGSFIIKKIRGKFQREISFSVGIYYADRWMEDSLYGILYKYNNITKNSKLELANANDRADGSGLYYKLADGVHSLKYRKYDILLVIQSTSAPISSGRITKQSNYTVITYNMDPSFITDFEADMISHRNKLLKINPNSPTVNVYQDYHEGDGYTYWDRLPPINKRRMSTIYLPDDQKNLIKNTLNNFFASKKFYEKHGITHKLNILLHGIPGVGKDSIARMIASEWNRNIYYVLGGKGGMFIPNAISDVTDDVIYPLFLISDIDKYPYIINEANIDLDDAKCNEEKIIYKQRFQNMINALDGLKSRDGRIVVMTTNHIEKFSPTFLRAGRVDLCLEIKPIIPTVFRKFVFDFYGEAIPDDIKLRSSKLTVADLQFDVVHLKLTFDEFMKKHTK